MYSQCRFVLVHIQHNSQISPHAFVEYVFVYFSITSLCTLDKASDTWVHRHMLHLIVLSKQCRSVKLSKGLFCCKVNSFCQFVLWCISYFMLPCPSFTHCDGWLGLFFFSYGILGAFLVNGSFLYSTQSLQKFRGPTVEILMSSFRQLFAMRLWYQYIIHFCQEFNMPTWNQKVHFVYQRLCIWIFSY